LDAATLAIANVSETIISEVNVKRVILFCQRCGETTKIEVLTREEIERDPHRPRRPPSCPKCGSNQVVLGE
jgi:hypothetical protein